MAFFFSTLLPMEPSPSLKVRSEILTGPADETSGAAHADRAAARAMLRATGWQEDDFRKPIIVVAVRRAVPMWRIPAPATTRILLLRPS